jgi:hypothetical protein
MSQATWMRVLLPPAITAAATLTAATIGVRLDAPGSDILFPTDTVTVTPSPTATVVTTTTVTASPIPPTPETPTGTPTAIGDLTYLADLPPVPPGGRLDSRHTRTVNKTAYTHALSNAMGGCGESGAVEWTTGAGTERFQAWVGLDDASRVATARVRFTLTLDGRLITPPLTVGLGPPQRIDVPVKDGLRLKLTTALVQGNADNDCAADAVAVWGDAALITASR